MQLNNLENTDSNFGTALVHGSQRCFLSATEQAISEIRDAATNLTSDRIKTFDQALATIKVATDARQALDQVLSGASETTTSKSGSVSYLTSSRFLNSLRKGPLKDRTQESMVLITGPIAPDGTRVLSEYVDIPYSERSAAFVQAVPEQSHLFQMRLKRDANHEVHAAIHSHLGKGSAITGPSSTDRTTDQRFKEAGCKMLTGIMSLDGYIRFFSTEFSFALSCFGSDAHVFSQNAKETIIKLSRAS